jgi:N-acetylglucosamine-6-sulfatase
MRSIGLGIAVLMAGLGARPLHAACTTKFEVRDLSRHLSAQTKCTEKRLKAGPSTTCKPIPPAPTCATTLASHVVEQIYGPNNPVTAGVDAKAMRKQLTCQRTIGRAATKMAVEKLRQLVNGRPQADAEARARRQLDRLPKRCKDTVVAQDTGSGVVLPAVGITCQTGVRTVGMDVDEAALRQCFIAAHETEVDAISPAPPPRPNVIVILTDDHRWDAFDTTHSLDGTTPVMPEVMEELVANGVTFPNAFVSTGLCCPSRASLLKGQYAHTTNVLNNNPPLGGAGTFDDSSTLATWLQGQGYSTGLFGKYLNGYSSLWTPPALPYVPPGWNEWHALKGAKFWDFRMIEHGAAHDHADNLYPSGCSLGSGCWAPGNPCTPANLSTDIIFQKAIDFIDGTNGQPFFAYIAPYAPHAPACAAPEDEGTYGALPGYRPPNFAEAGDPSDKPIWVQNLCTNWYANPTNNENQVDAFRRNQLESLQPVDRGVGALMDKLREIGQDANTLIVFTGDNGYAWGAHCHKPKHCPYDECFHVPMIVRYPALIPTPRVDTRMALNIDIAFTFAELAGVVPPVQEDGTSLVRVLGNREPASSWRSDFLYEQWFGNAEDDDPLDNVVPPKLAGVRTPQYKYIEYDDPAPEINDDVELYDLTIDPFELQNRHGDPAYAAVEAALAARLRQLRTDWTP